MTTTTTTTLYWLITGTWSLLPLFYRQGMGFVLVCPPILETFGAFRPKINCFRTWKVGLLKKTKESSFFSPVHNNTVRLEVINAIRHPATTAHCRCVFYNALRWWCALDHNGSVFFFELTFTCVQHLGPTCVGRAHLFLFFPVKGEHASDGCCETAVVIVWQCMLLTSVRANMSLKAVVVLVLLPTDPTHIRTCRE